MIRIHPFRTRGVEGIRIHKTSDALSIGLDRIGILFDPWVLWINHQGSKPNTGNVARFAHTLCNRCHAHWEFLIGTPIAIHLLITVIDLDDALTKGVWVRFDGIRHVEHVLCGNSSGRIIPAAPAVNWPLVQACAVCGCHPTCPNVRRCVGWLKAEDHLLTAATRASRHQHIVHRNRCDELLIAKLNMSVGFSRPDRTNEEALTIRILKQRRLIEALFSHIISDRVGILHQRSDQPLGCIGNIECPPLPLAGIEEVKVVQANVLTATVMNHRLHRKRIHVPQVFQLERILKREIRTAISRLQ